MVCTGFHRDCRRRNHRTGSTHSSGEHSDQSFPYCSLFHSIIPLKLLFIVVCLLLLWKRSRCVHCVVMRIDTTSSEISGICLSILYHAFCRKSIVGIAKEYVYKLYTMLKRLREQCRARHCRQDMHLQTSICTAATEGDTHKKSRGAWRRSPGVRVFALVEIALSV